jgi:hypothetical protein
MTKIILDASASNKLSEASHPVNLCDPSGRLLGQFIPLPLVDPAYLVLDPAEWEVLSPPLSDEELERRMQNDKRFTTAEVLAYLEKL